MKFLALPGGYGAVSFCFIPRMLPNSRCAFLVALVETKQNIAAIPGLDGSVSSIRTPSWGPKAGGQLNSARQGRRETPKQINHGLWVGLLAWTFDSSWIPGNLPWNLPRN